MRGRPESGDAPAVDDGLVGRRYIVTGAGSGIGKAVAAMLGSSGASVMLADRDSAAVALATRELTQQGYSAASCVARVEDEAEVGHMIESTVSAFGGIDGVVTSAGIMIPSLAVDLSRAQFDEVVGVNLTGTFLCATAAARHIVARGGAGSIVTIASAMAFTGEVMHGHYAASKAGVIALTKSLAREWGPLGIRVNCVSPGYIDTPLNDSVADEHRRGYVEQTPLLRVGVPDDVAKTVCFLLSADAGYITGQSIVVNGGFIMPA
jgi:NAD(P)-dependent dehydrogenase (short-subunit alcohol dehydrogenase family)